MKPDPDHEAYLRQWSELYQHANYDQGIAGWLLRQSHAWAESAFGHDAFFGRVLEVGAGTGTHLSYVRHRFDEYVLSDINPLMLRHCDNRAPAQAVHARVLMSVQDATRLSFRDASFDRVIATHVLEHLQRPHEVLREWARVLKPGGVLSLVLPCDPGFAWRAGRALAVRGRLNRLGLEYDYWMAREHINPILNLVTFLRYYFSDLDEAWRPWCFPSTDLNLFYIAHARV